MQISFVHTPCKECIFAQYDDLTQVGCEVGMLEKFRSKGCEIVEVYDNDKEFFVINNVRCFCARSEKWKAKQTGDLLETLQSELKIDYQIVLFEQGHYEPVIETLKDLVAQTLPPTHITIVNKEGPGFASKFLEFFENNSVNSWKIQNVTNPNISVEEAVNQITAFRKEPYIGIFFGGAKIPPDTFETINKLIFDDMEIFTYIKPNSEGNGKIIPYFIFQKAKAMGMRVEDIPAEYAKVLEITTICPNFPK